MPPSLVRFLDGEADDVQSISQREGSLTTRVDGSHVHITVRLRTWWARLAGWFADADALDAICDWLEAAAAPADYLVKSAAILGAAYILYSIAGALISHGVIARLIGGAQ
jgi:hypothetical protein